MNHSLQLPVPGIEAQVVCRADHAHGLSAATVLAEPLIAVTATATVVIPA